MKKQLSSNKTDIKYNSKFRFDGYKNYSDRIIIFDPREDCDFLGDPRGSILIGNGNPTDLDGVKKAILLSKEHMPYTGRLVSSLTFVYQIPRELYHCGFAFGMIKDDKPDLIFLNRTTKIGITLLIPPGCIDLGIKELNRFWIEEIVGKERFRSLIKMNII